MNVRFDLKSLLRRALFVLVLLAWLLLSVNAQDTNNRVSPDFRLTSGQSARNIPLELYMNLIFLQVRANDSKTLWFNLDTGLETSILDSSQAEALGLKLEGKSNVSVPGGTIELAFVNGVSF